MSSISKPNTFSANTTISSSEVNANFDTIYNNYNGNIDADNLAANAVTTAKIADGAVTAAKLASGLVDSGWVTSAGTHSVATGYNAGNRSFTIDTSSDLSGTLSPGMRYKVTRNTTPPTQCADLEASSSQYASVASPTGITFTDDFTCEAWIKLESYTGAAQSIVSRFNGTSGFLFWYDSSGILILSGYNASGANYSRVQSYQAIPLGKWVHIAAKLDMSAFTYTNTTSQIYIDGVEVPGQVVRAGTNPTALVQAGNLELGAYNSGTGPFDGKLADVRVWSDKRTTTEIQDNMYAYPSDTTGLVAHFKLNGDFTDASSNGNDLTAQNSAVATNADNPWNATEYGIITAVSASDIQVFCPEGYGIPNETLTAPYYSTQSAPYGFPRSERAWFIELQDKRDSTLANNTTIQNLDTFYLPVGAWRVESRVIASSYRVAGTGQIVQSGISDSSSAWSGGYNLATGRSSSTAERDTSTGDGIVVNYIDTSTQKTLYLNTQSVATPISFVAEGGTYGPHIIRAICSYL